MVAITIIHYSQYKMGVVIPCSSKCKHLSTFNFKIDDVTQKKLMTLSLNLPPELEQYLLQAAQQQGLSVETYTLQILQEYILTQEKQSNLVNLLQSWIDKGITW